MSYEVFRKTISATSCMALATNIANYLSESSDSELTLASSKTVSTYYKHVYVSYKGTKAGVGFTGYTKSGSSELLYLHIAASITSSNGASVYPGSSQGSSSGMVSLNPNKVTRSGTTYYEIDTVLCRITNGYVISLNGICMYIGEYHSSIYGDCLLGLNFRSYSGVDYNGHISVGESTDSWKSYRYYGSNSNYQYNSALFSADGSTYHQCCPVTFLPSTQSIDDNSAILSPVYVVCSNVWVEPILISDLYYMTAAGLPGLFEQAVVGDISVYRVSANTNTDQNSEFVVI